MDSIREARNPHQFSGGGITVSEMSKPGNYNAVLGQMRGSYEERKRTFKRQQNIDMGWGGLGSEYAITGNRTYGW